MIMEDCICSKSTSIWEALQIVGSNNRHIDRLTNSWKFRLQWFLITSIYVRAKGSSQFNLAQALIICWTRTMNKTFGSQSFIPRSSPSSSAIDIHWWWFMTRIDFHWQDGCRFGTKNHPENQARLPSTGNYRIRDKQFSVEFMIRPKLVQNILMNR